ncbi:MAG: hypothetical protein M0Z89_02980 [Nitrospiraceae bacterium]|nr:hypothetical protein [Nitrospiraceae bacterium]MDA8422279.1 hypothetical protein [Nitrospiraceae bacterium]
MKRQITKKAFLTLGLICLLFVMIPVTAFSWNQATHAYIADRLNARVGYDNLNEMWGSVAPDLYNFVFDPALCPGWIADQTQGTYSETFMKVWNAAETNSEDALAYGFVSHNQQWGADYTAHISGLRPGYENEGYIITKAKLLLNAPLDPASPQQTFGDVFAGLGMSPDEALLIAHVITEDAVDIRLGNEVDPLLGRRLATSARNETKRFRALLIKAYAADYADYCFGGDLSTAASVLTATEEGHRKDMIFLGQAISQSEPAAAQLLAEQLVSILPEFLGHALPVPEAEAVRIVKAAIFQSMGICDDYLAEINATIEFVGKNLEDHGIIYLVHGNPK